MVHHGRRSGVPTQPGALGDHATGSAAPVDVGLDELARPSFSLLAAGSATPVRLAVHGEHQVGNALSAAAVALECGAAPEQVA